MYQQLPTSSDPVPSYINQYHSVLTQYHQVSTSTKLYCCCLGLQTSAQFTPGLVSSLVHLWPCQIWMIQTNFFISHPIKANLALPYLMSQLLFLIPSTPPRSVWSDLSLFEFYPHKVFPTRTASEKLSQASFH